MLCRYQNSTVAYHFSTIGYLIPIMSILTVPVLPRARFIQNLLVTCVLTPVNPIKAFVGLTCNPLTAFDLLGSRTVAACHVVCSPGSSQYDPSLQGSEEQWSCSGCPSQSVQCRRQC